MVLAGRGDKVGLRLARLRRLIASRGKNWARFCCGARTSTTTLTGTNPNPTVGEVSTLGGVGTWQGRRPSVQVTVALSTLLGLDEQPGELDGYGPVPAPIARRIAADPTGTWRRLLTDPQGHLIDYGRTTYRPPADLRDHILTRDHTDRFPSSNRPSRRSTIDHITDWQHGGGTNADNLQPLSSRGQMLKHEAGWHVHRDNDGTTHWTSPHGRHYTKPADTHPIDTTTSAPDEPPPF